MLQEDVIFQKNTAVILDNLSKRQTKKENNDIVRSAYLKELAYQFVQLCKDYYPDEAIELIRDEYRNLRLADILKDDEKFIFYNHLAEALEKLFELSLEAFINDRTQSPYRLCYVKNHFSDIAYRIFDEELRGVTSEYADSFELAAQSVFYENSSGCILPYESEDGGIMSGIHAIEKKYELNKSLVCYVDAGGILTKFVLFTRGIWVGRDANKLEFTVNTENFFHCSDIVTAGKCFGFDDMAILSSPFGGENERKSSFIFTGDKSKIFKMLLYLNLEFERSNISGIYKEIETERIVEF